MNNPRIPESLIRFGDELESAIGRDLSRRDVAVRGVPWRRRRRQRLVALTAALAIVLPAGAIAASSLFGPAEVAQSLPAGTRALIGTDPECTVVRQDVEYRCVLERAPTEFPDYAGTVEPTVDATRHINGGCRSESSQGTVWRCFIGRAAVQERIIGADFLGEYAPTPGVG